MTISKLASDVAENHWETKGMKHALQAERDYNLMTTQKLERLKVQNVSFPGGVGGNKFVVQMFLMPRGMNGSKIQISYH